MKSKPSSSTASSPSLQLDPPPTRKPAASSSTQVAAPVAEEDSSDIEIIAVKTLSNKRRLPSNKNSNNIYNDDDDDIVEIDARTGRPVARQTGRSNNANPSSAQPPATAQRKRQSRRRIQDQNEEAIRVIGIVNTSGNSISNESGMMRIAGDRSRFADMISSMLPGFQPRSVTIPQVIPASQLFTGSNTSVNAAANHPSVARNNLNVLKALEKAKSMLPPEEEAAPAQLKCSICLELSSVTSKISSTNCGHLFCDECLASLFAMPGATKCPNCRKGITKKGCRRVFLS